MNNFLDQVKQVLTDSGNNRSVTENGAVGYKTSGKKLLDLNFAVSSMREWDERKIIAAFQDAYGENPTLAIVWLFFARDVRGGLGERRLFRVCMQYLAREFPSTVRKLLPIIAEYGRWDDLLQLMDTSLSSDVAAIVRDQLTKDMKGMKAGKPISLLAKWLPSENASSKETKEAALKMVAALHVRPRSYRLMLSALRSYLNIIEKKMSENEWQSIDYQAVPSRANLIYNSAFLRHDEDRRRAFLSKLEKGEAKINASVLFPHDIVHKYNSYSYRNMHVDPAVEAMWKSLPDLPKNDGGTIVVADGSGSMTTTVAGTKVSALEVANSLAIYFSERLTGPYKNQYITFSEHPQLVDLSGASSLLGKLQIARRHDEVANTNVEAVFDLILATAVKNHLPQSSIPSNILIISDMEFDACACDNNPVTHGWYRSKSVSPTLFDAIAKKYNRYGYQLPRLVFWNVCSRTGTIPVKENALGVALVSGFSTNVAKMVMSNTVDPMDALLETLNDKRYDPVREVLKA